MRKISYVWAFPVTLLGLSLAMLAVVTGGAIRLRGGVLEAWGGAVSSLLQGSRYHRGGAAMTLGHVILARDLGCLEKSRSHELVHVRQFEQWGPLLLPSVSRSSIGTASELHLKLETVNVVGSAWRFTSF